MKDSGVYLYSHWGSGNIVDQVHTALSKKWRWTDEEYLTRIIFDVMKGTDVTSETSFGIGTQKHGDIDNMVTVDCDKQKVSFESYGDGHFDMSFDDFISHKVNNNCLG